MQRGGAVAAVIIGSLILAGSAARLAAEDVITTRTQTFRGRVTGMDAQGVRIQLGQGGEMTIPRAGIVALKVEPPPSVVRGIAAYEKGDMRDAQLQLGRVMLQYLGLDTDWAIKGMLYYGRASQRAGDHANAAKALRAFLDQYPDHPLALDANISLAQIDRAAGRHEPALARFEDLLAPLAAQLKPAQDQLPYAAELLIAIADCREALGRPAEALDACLQAIALCPVEPYYSDAMYRGARLHAAAGRWAKADQLLGELIEHGTDRTWIDKGIADRKTVRARLAETPGAAAAPGPAQTPDQHTPRE